MKNALWQILQLSDVLDLEFASALSETLEVLAWLPKRSILPNWLRSAGEKESMSILSPGLQRATEGGVRTRSLPLMRGFSKVPLSWMAGTTRDVLSRMLRQTAHPESSTLVCTVPFFAEIAELWPGPVVYWLTDLISEYPSANRSQIVELDRRMARVATLLCPNSKRLSEYLIEQAACERTKICILPNATRISNVYAAPPNGPGPRPDPIAGVSEPMAGIIGNLAGNMDWLLLDRLIQLTPWLSWVFVGPTSMPIADVSASRARLSVMHQPNTYFVGAQPYGALAAYARCFDVAVLPYRRCEPTYSGSSTRFYEHLAACRPMISTRGLEELTHKTDVLSLIDTAEEGATALEQLRGVSFDDGLVERRWKASRHGTWQYRAACMQEALGYRLQVQCGTNEVASCFS